MQITDVRLHPPSPGDRVLAYATVVFDDTLCVRDVRLLPRPKGGFIVAMPSRKLCDHCPTCATKTGVTDRYCHGCGARLDDRRGGLTNGELHRDVCFPVNNEARKVIEDAVIGAFEAAAAGVVAVVVRRLAFGRGGYLDLGLAFCCSAARSRATIGARMRLR